MDVCRSHTGAVVAYNSSECCVARCPLCQAEQRIRSLEDDVKRAERMRDEARKTCSDLYDAVRALRVEHLVSAAVEVGS